MKRRDARGAWAPVFSITPKAAKGLMRIEAVRAEVAHIPIPPPVEAELRRQARVRSTHFSTRIEGNRLTLDEAERVIRDDRAVFHGRERDVSEVRNYWNARLRVEEWAESGRSVTEDLIRRLHALVEKGPRARPTPYRDGQNAIRDAGSGALVYLPPEPKDVPGLMKALVVHPHHNYYMGRAAADLSDWLEYFAATLAQTFGAVGAEARRLVAAGVQTEPAFLRKLDRRARTVLALFARQERITAGDVAEALGLSDRMARLLLKAWVADGWLEMTDPSRKARTYGLSAIYRQYMDGLSAITKELPPA